MPSTTASILRGLGLRDTFRLRSTIAAAFLSAALMVGAPAAEHPPMDHQGAGLVLADGDKIWGTHCNVGAFHVPVGVNVRVLSFDGSDQETGRMEVFARTITIEGTLNGDGAGFTGGGGGGGGGGSTSGNTQGGAGGQGAYPGFAGNSGSNGSSSFPPQNGIGGNGGRGDGPHGGRANADPGSILREGGYAGPAGNLDLSTDDSTRRGSGGAGSNGIPLFGGGGGGMGGAEIRLVAEELLALGPAGVVSANGLLGANANGKPGGFSLPAQTGSHASPGQPRGGAGAGGGILLRCNTAGLLFINDGARIRSSGGAGLVNGGTVKVFHSGAAPAFPEGSVIAGRLFFSRPVERSAWIAR